MDTIQTDTVEILRKRIRAKFNEMYAEAVGELTPIDPAKLHEMRTNGTRKELMRRWVQQFERVGREGDAAGLIEQRITFLWPAFFDESGALDAVVEAANEDTDTEASIYTPKVLLALRPSVPVTGYDDYDDDQQLLFALGDIEAGLARPQFKAFLEFSMKIKHALDALGDSLDALLNPDPNTPQPIGPRDFNDGDDETAAPRAPMIIPEVIPVGPTIVHGYQEHGKSRWCQKMGLCVASEDAQFEGIDIEHGKVLYVTLDDAATIADIKPGMIQIRDRLGLAPIPAGRITLSQDPLFLDDAHSVDAFIKKHRPLGPFKIVYIDPLYKALLGGDPRNVGAIAAAGRAVGRMLRELPADGVVIITHDTKSGGPDPYGTMFQGAGAAAQIQVVRRKGDRVTVDVQFIKNGQRREEGFEYKMVGPYLEPWEPGPTAAEKSATFKVSKLHADILAALPPSLPNPRDAFGLVKHLFKGEYEAQKKAWQRARDDMFKAGLFKTNDDGALIKTAR